jgi:hypothetical protein
MKSRRVQPLYLKERPLQKRARPITAEAAPSARDPHWGLIIAAITVGAFVSIRGRFRVNITAPIVIRMGITGDMAGIATELSYG